MPFIHVKAKHEKTASSVSLPHTVKCGVSRSWSCHSDPDSRISQTFDLPDYSTKRQLLFSASSLSSLCSLSGIRCLGSPDCLFACFVFEQSAFWVTPCFSAIPGWISAGWSSPCCRYASGSPSGQAIHCYTRVPRQHVSPGNDGQRTKDRSLCA